uniref:RanBP-type and C3HC4-type zinc finger-containing protein 1 n=1 Tax=Bicosoecida sp. CB-2014 TaxID=1486930 RepID=A0A7S1G633_9STRA|mmetsp:Transcript_15997/g.55858  ORF Transcript_15997/g.55858 Transcript_15997/m.55858 type:complete len:1009 (+) Transcript_15997:214-3240(+)
MAIRYTALVLEALVALQDAQGSSPASVDAFIRDKHGPSLATYNRSALYAAIQQLLTRGELVEGARGRLRLARAVDAARGAAAAAASARPRRASAASSAGDGAGAGAGAGAAAVAAPSPPPRRRHKASAADSHDEWVPPSSAMPLAEGAAGADPPSWISSVGSRVASSVKSWFGPTRARGTRPAVKGDAGKRAGTSAEEKRRRQRAAAGLKRAASRARGRAGAGAGAGAAGSASSEDSEHDDDDDWVPAGERRAKAPSPARRPSAESAATAPKVAASSSRKSPSGRARKRRARDSDDEEWQPDGEGAGRRDSVAGRRRAPAKRATGAKQRPGAPSRAPRKKPAAPWNCGLCTFVNVPGAGVCEACGELRDGFDAAESDSDDDEDFVVASPRGGQSAASPPRSVASSTAAKRRARRRKNVDPDDEAWSPSDEGGMSDGAPPPRAKSSRSADKAVEAGSADAAERKSAASKAKQAAAVRKAAAAAAKKLEREQRAAEKREAAAARKAERAAAAAEKRAAAAARKAAAAVAKAAKQRGAKKGGALEQSADGAHDPEKDALQRKLEETQAQLARMEALHRAAEARERSHLINFTWEEVCSATNNFSDENKLGSGGFGVVFAGQLKGAQVAVKRLHHGVGTSRGAAALEQLHNELRTLARYRSANLVQLIGVCMPQELDGKQEPCIVYQRMHGDLYDRLRPPGGDGGAGAGSRAFPWWQRLQCLIDVARGLVFLHTAAKDAAIVHLDVKPENVLMDSHGAARLGDFGIVHAVETMGAGVSDDGGEGGGGGAGAGAGAGGDADRRRAASMTVSVKVREKVGTLGYMAPEYVATGSVSVKCDSYSFGVLVAELMTARDPCPKDGEALVEVIADADDDAALASLLDAAAGWPAAVAERLWPVVRGCTEPRRKTRWSMERALSALETLVVAHPAPSGGAGAGVNGAAAAASAAAGDAEDGGEDVAPDRECAVCMDAEKTHLLMPCRHLLLCEACAEGQPGRECPTCRAPCDSVVRIFW